MAHTVTKKRSLFAELMEGVDAMKHHREGKITLRSHEVGERPPLSKDALSPMPKPRR
jgi:putative transcriptional regulator